MAATRAPVHRRIIRIGAVELRPAACEVVGPNGRENVQPKVMRVLAVLAEAEGETVSRDDLVHRCWDGRVVGDDSINRVVFKIRKLAEGIGSGSFAVRTIAKVGYRLVETGAVRLPGGAPRSDHASTAGRPALRPVLAALLLLAVIASTGVASRRSASEARPAPSFFEAAARDLGMRGAAAAFEGAPAGHVRAIGYFERAVERTPDDAGLWGSLALNHSLAAAARPPERQGVHLAGARRAAERSLALNPREGHALAALLAIRPNFGNWAAREAEFDRALARMDGRSPAPLYQHARFLASTGRVRQASATIEKAYALHPLVPWIAVERINLLAATGRVGEAERAAAGAAKLWPRDEDLWAARFFLHAFHGAPDRARRLAQDRSAWPEGARPSDMELMARTASAIASPAGRDDAAVVRDWSRLAGEGQNYAEQAIRVAAFLGRDGEALRIGAMLLGDRAPAVTKRFTDHDEYALAGERATAVLFVPPADRLWRDPRFMELMSTAGLTSHWRRGFRPDLCRAPALAERCAGQRLAAPSHAGPPVPATAGEQPFPPPNPVRPTQHPDARD